MFRNNLIVFVLLVATACMSGCATAPAPVVQVKALTPPDALLKDCTHAPRPAGRTVADLAQWLINERGQLDACTADKAALRTWKAGVATP
jgi:hypothetical protein